MMLISADTKGIVNTFSKYFSRCNLQIWHEASHRLAYRPRRSVHNTPIHLHNLLWNSTTVADNNKLIAEWNFVIYNDMDI